MVVVIVVLGAVYYRLQLFYRASSRRLDGTTRSPVLTLLCDCIVDAVCIRSLGPVVTVYCEERLVSALDDNMRVFMSLSVASQVCDFMLYLYVGY